MSRVTSKQAKWLPELKIVRYCINAKVQQTDSSDKSKGKVIMKKVLLILAALPLFICGFSQTAGQINEHG